MRLLPFVLLASSVAGCGEADAVLPTNGGAANEVAGGTRDLRWASSGYLTSGTSMAGLDRSRPTCGATLVASNVALTAAHCVLDEKATYAFGTGDAGGGPVTRVVERHIHPKFSATTHAFDIAYVVLEEDVAFVRPAELPTVQPAAGCTVQAIGYRSAAGAIAVRASTPACVSVAANGAAESLLEVHPERGGALCLADSDDGSAVVERDASRTVLVGIYVGGPGGCSPGSVASRPVLAGENPNAFESTFDVRDFLSAATATAIAPH